MINENLLISLVVECLMDVWRLQVIQREVELHGKIVNCVLRRCERLVRVEEQGRRYDPCQVTRTARDLERRWQLLFIRSLEWVCHIDNLLSKRANTKVSV